VILQLDIGNSRVKWRLCSDGKVLDRGVESRSQFPASLAGIGESRCPDAVWVSSVAGEDSESILRQQIGDLWGVTAWFARPAARACGLVNSYPEPQRMGVDRWLAMLAGWRDAASAVCVVDAGSALTIDFVASDGQHEGGYILPGLDSMERALLSDTDRVRFADAARDQLAPGRSTEEAVYNGLFLSQAGAVTLALQQSKGDYSLYFTGGDGHTLFQRLGLGGKFEADLVLDGLEILAAEQMGAGGGKEP
jgi:type III pantothenate kinase